VKSISILLIDSLPTLIVESTYLRVYLCKFESLLKDRSRLSGAQSTDSSKAYRKPRSLNCLVKTIYQQ